MAIERETGPHVWLAQRWRPTGQPFAGITIELYPAGRPRIHGLKPNTPSLGPDHAARRLSFVGDKVGAAVNAVRACALAAGVIRADEPQRSDTTNGNGDL